MLENMFRFYWFLKGKYKKSCIVKYIYLERSGIFFLLVLTSELSLLVNFLIKSMQNVGLCRLIITMQTSWTKSLPRTPALKDLFISTVARNVSTIPVTFKTFEEAFWNFWNAGPTVCQLKKLIHSSNLRRFIPFHSIWDSLCCGILSLPRQ